MLSMNDLLAMSLREMAMSLRDTTRVFDWDEAAQLIRATDATSAKAGLQGDWKYTGGDILKDGKPVPNGETYTYLASTWAIPELDLGDGVRIPCWCWQSATPGWDANTYWPESALAILGAK